MLFATLLTIASTVAHAIPGPHAAQLSEWGARPRGPAAPPLAPAPASPGATVYGYYPYWGDDPSSLPYDRLTHIAIFGVYLESDGSLSSTSTWDSLASEIVPLAHAAGVRVHLCVISFEDDVHAAVLGSSSKRAAAIAAMAELVEEQGADGVNIDFEGLDSDLKEEMVTFIEDLADAVEDVYLATPAVDWSGAWDYSELSAAADGLFIMGYDYHWSGGDPGPNSPLYGSDTWGSYALDWTVDDYITYGATPDKIVLGLPLYGRWWPSDYEVGASATGDGESYTFTSAVSAGESAGRRWDDESRTPYAFFDGGQLWYDDTDSLAERISWAVTDQGLQGVGFWALTYEDNDAEFWDMVSSYTASAGGDDGGGDSGGGDSGGGDVGGGDGGGDDGGVDSAPPSDGQPVARAGVAFMAYPGDTVILDGSASSDPGGAELKFRWTQVGGATVALEGGATAEPSFVAPAPGTLSFELVVNNGEQYSDPDVVDVVVADPEVGERWMGGGCQTVPGAGWGLVVAAAAAMARRRRRAQ